MRLLDMELHLPPTPGHAGLFDHLAREVMARVGELAPGADPVRFAVVHTDAQGYDCELGLLVPESDADRALLGRRRLPGAFELRRRTWDDHGAFNVVLLVPTGIGAELGGHAGDGGPLARVVASVCDTLITHPNVVNGADINELPENGLYCEGSAIASMMAGTVALQPVRANRVLLVSDAHPEPVMAALAVNAASAARACLGMTVPEVVQLDPPLPLESRYSGSGAAVGRVDQLERLCAVLDARVGDCDAVALSTLVDISLEQHSRYLEARGGIVNPWGGVEAVLTHAVTHLYGVPSAHAPQMLGLDMLTSLGGEVDPRMAAEEVSAAFLHCVLKGLHRAPRLVVDPVGAPRPGQIGAEQIGALVVPDGCLGLPVLAAIEQGIPVIAVRENANKMRNPLEALDFAPGRLHVVDTHLEAIGVLAALRAGVAVDSVRRPLGDTPVRLVRQRGAGSGAGSGSGAGGGAADTPEEAAGTTTSASPSQR